MACAPAASFPKVHEDLPHVGHDVPLPREPARTTLDHMINDVDSSLRELIRRDAVRNGDVEIAFDAPTREWAGKRSVPTINVYLFDIREDVQRRRVEPERVRDDDGTVIGRRRPPRRYRLSYLVTAWTQRAEDEHRLLAAVLRAFLPHDEFPRDLLQGSLADELQPLYQSIGLPPPAERSIGELWSAMGGELKPSLDLVLSVPFVLDELQPAGPPVTEQPRLTLEDDEGRSETLSLPGQRPFPGPRPEPQGNGDQPAQDSPEPAEGDEVVTGGGDDDRGRVFRVRRIKR